MEPIASQTTHQRSDNPVNILILSAGRRVELVRAFKHAARRLGIEGKVIAADKDPLAPALYFADDHDILPPIHSEGYLEAVTSLAERHNISLIVPTIDADLRLLAAGREAVRHRSGARVLVSAPEVVSICADKFQTSDFLRSTGLPQPKVYSLTEARTAPLPLFIKPRTGSSSLGAYRVESLAELEAYAQIVDEPIIQEFVEGPEYTIDCFLDFDGNIVSIVPRLRLATRSGEISKGRIDLDPDIISSSERLLRSLSPIGHITVQGIKTEHGFVFLEINPRFGGGAPMSIDSGADSCMYLYRLLRGESLTRERRIRDKVTYLRFDASIALDETLRPLGTKNCEPS